MICHWDDVPWRTREHGELRFARQRLSAPRGGAGATLSRYRIAPGARSTPQHVHVDEEELLYVLGGSGQSWQDDVRHEIGAGDLIVHRADRETHTMIASHDDHLEVLAFASGSVTGLTSLTTRHCHSHEDELFVVLHGAGELLLGDERHAVRRGSVVARPRGTGVAHAFEAGGDGLTLLAYGTREPGDTCWYPDSRKVSFRGLGVVARVEPLDLWDGEQ